MSDATSDASQLKEVLKTVIVEILQEQKEVLTDLLTEAIEDIALAKAIEEGDNTEPVSREAIFNLSEEEAIQAMVCMTRSPKQEIDGPAIARHFSPSRLKPPKLDLCTENSKLRTPPFLPRTPNFDLQSPDLKLQAGNLRLKASGLKL